MVSEEKKADSASKSAPQSSALVRFIQNLQDFSSPVSASQTLKVKKNLNPKRVRWVILFLCLGLIFCVARLGYVQLVIGTSLANTAQNERTFSWELQAKRGDILDRKGRVLATSVEIYDVSVNQKLVKDYIHYEYVDPEGKIRTNKEALENPRIVLKKIGTGPAEAARQLAPLLEMDPAVLGGKLVGDRGFVYLAKGISPEKWSQIRALAIDGIDGERRYVRDYPNGSVAASILGYIDHEGKGVAGIEASQEKELAGISGKRTVEISGSGQAIPGGMDIVEPAKPGRNVELTIDLDLNAMAEETINATIAKHQAEWGCIVVQEIDTGKILALADSGNLHPDKMRMGLNNTTGSRAVQYSFEPGSTIKLVTFAEGLKENKVTPESRFTVPYSITMPNGQSFHDSHGHATVTMTSTGILSESSNTGTVQVGDLLSDKGRWELMRNLGLGQKTGIEMPGESQGILAPWDKWDGRQRYTTMFGQGLSTSALQITQMVATLSKGIRQTPTIIENYQSEHGVTESPKAHAPEQVLSPEVSKKLVLMMESGTKPDGVSRRAAVAGYRVGAKTGTSEIINSSGKVIANAASVVGVAPAEDPKIAISVVVYNPKSGLFGVVTAAPAFSKVMGETLAMLDIPPSKEPAQLYAYH